MPPAMWVPPSPGYYLRIFVLGLSFVVVSLAVFLFAVHMDAPTPATGTITARGMHEVRSPQEGLVNPGWFEAAFSGPDDNLLSVRLDRRGNGLAHREDGVYLPVRDYQITQGLQNHPVPPDAVRWHRLEAGDELWPGQIVALLDTEDLAWHIEQLEERLRHRASTEALDAELDRLRLERDTLRRQLARTIITVPPSTLPWLTVRVALSPGEMVSAGGLLAVLVPVDPTTHQPRDLMVRLDIEEEHWSEIQAGQSVRIRSALFGRRHGHATGRIERLEPSGERTADGRCCFHAVATVTEMPFPLALGSTCKAEILVGKKPVYQLILEH